jgi:hypothetical protein
MQTRFSVIATIILGLIPTSPAAAFPAKLIIMRHAEKPGAADDDSGSPDLNGPGYDRANALPGLFIGKKHNPELENVVAIYAMAPNKPGGSMRPIETVRELSKHLGLPIRTLFTQKQTTQLVNEIASHPEYNGGSVVICWEHKAINDLVDVLNLDRKKFNIVAKWPGDMFNQIWIPSFTAEGEPVDFKIIHEHINPGDQ